MVRTDCVHRINTTQTYMHIHTHDNRNPFYKNTKKTCEPHIMHKFESDFYGKELRLVVTCYIRPEANFDSFDALIKAIQDDIDFTDRVMDATPHKEQKNSSFFSASSRSGKK